MTAGETTAKKVLVIGSPGHAGAKCVDWTSLKAVPNLADFQVVVINSCTLAAWIDALRAERDSADEKRAEALEKLGSSMSKSLTLLKAKLLQVMRAGGAVFAILPGQTALPSRQYYAIVSSHEWLPLPVQLRHEPGDTLRLEEQDFARYFAQVTNWTHVFSGRYNRGELKAITDDDLEPKPLVQLASYSIATDWQGNSVGVVLRYTLHRPTTGPLANALVVARGDQPYEKEPYLQSGPLVLLSPPTEVSDEEAIRMLLEDLCGVQARSVAPAWAQSVAMPGDDERRAAAVEATKALEEAQRRQQKALAAQVAADEFKRLLYETGLPLQDAARRTFEAIGIDTVESPVSDEFMLVRGEKKVLVEVTGVRKSIATRDLSQLIKDIGKYLGATGEPIKGLLVGNAWKDLPPEERNTGEKPIFPDDLLKTARSHSVALLSTLELFRAYCVFLEGTLDGDEAFGRLTDTSGPVKLVD